MSEEEKTGLNCALCGDHNWENVDKFRLKPVGMHICKSCGFISYPYLWGSTAEIKAYYKNHYRTAPTAQNFYSGQRKLHYHNAFINPYLEEIKKTPELPFRVYECGAAIGMFLHWLKMNVPHAEIYGSEWTETFRRCSFFKFGIELTEEMDESKTYDLITSYKVLEHQLNPMEELKKYHSRLSEHGKLYVSVPTWFNTLVNFGLGGFDIEYYYSTNHINVWNRQMFHNVLLACGFKPIKVDLVMYSDTYLCEKIEPQDINFKGGYINTMSNLDKVKSASELAIQNKFSQAIEIWNDFPLAHQGTYESQRAKLDKMGIDYIEQLILKPALAMCPDSYENLLFCGDIYRRYNKFEMARKLLEKAYQERPGSPVALMKLIQTLVHAAETTTEPSEAAELFRKANHLSHLLERVSLQNLTESLNWQFATMGKMDIESAKNARVQNGSGTGQDQAQAAAS